MPSSQEGFGIVYVEALASGKTVIAGNQDGSREALLDGRLGILIDPQEQPQLTAALINALKHDIEPRLYDPLFLRESAKEEFSYDVFNRRVKGVFGRILN
jgi:glycosyltransferase involved in cell wall biosynthesis